MIYCGIVYIVIGLLLFAWGIESKIPTSEKGHHFITAEDGYDIYSVKLKNATYDNGDEVNVLTMEKKTNLKAERGI